MFKILRQIFESLRFALQSVMINKMRTFLSLLGITIGIFAIISIFTAIDSLSIYVRKSLEGFGSNTVFVGKWPWAPEGDGEFKWWKYVNRPNVTLNERTELAKLLDDKLDSHSAIAQIFRTVKFETTSKEGTEVVGVDYEYSKINSMDVEKGRYFSQQECSNGHPIVILGASVADDLFGDVDPVGKNIKIGDRRVSVIGVFKREGNGAGFSNDNFVVMPINYMKTLANLRNVEMQVMFKCRQNVDFEQFKFEVESYFRQIRRIKPNAENTFSINVMDILTKQLDQVFGMINIVGSIIGVFSILVGGFGVANIMFVSVAERTSQIGIQKAIGAKPYAILLQFIFEAIFLSLVGGAVGLFLIWVIAMIVNSFIDFEIVLTLNNILIGLGISTAVGVLSGFFPAWRAANMSPVNAIHKTT